MLSKKKSVKIMVFDDFLWNRWFLQNSDDIISFVSSFYIKICILLYYFDQYFLRYKPSKIHQNPGFIAALIVSACSSISSNRTLMYWFTMFPFSKNFLFSWRRRRAQLRNFPNNNTIDMIDSFNINNLTCSSLTVYI